MDVSNSKLVFFTSFCYLGFNSKVTNPFQNCREFRKMVKKIIIYSSEEVKKMSNLKPRSSSLECEGMVVGMDSEHRADT